MITTSKRVFALLPAGALIVAGALTVAARAGETGDDVTTPAATDEVPTEAAGLIGRRIVDIAGEIHTIGAREGDRATVLVFMGTECPVSNRYVPQLNRLAKAAGEKDVDFFGVISDGFVTRKAAVEHAKEFGVEFPVLFDGSFLLGQALKPANIPTAFVLDTTGQIVYRGAVDDRWETLARPRNVVTHDWLSDAIDAIAAGRPVAVGTTEAVGCVYEPRRPTDGEYPEVTFYRDVAPILDANCVECHRKGEIGPFSLTTYGDAAKRADLLALVCESRLMPPWPPKKGHGEFLDECRMSTDEIAVLRKWSELDAPRGNPLDKPTAPHFAPGWKLGEPDLVLEMKEGYTVAADGADVFRCFVLPMNLTEDKKVVAVEYKPGAPSVVHHALFFLDNQQRGRRLEERSAGVGYPSFGGVGFMPDGALGGFAPGARPTFLPKGIARFVDQKADVILQVHYHPSGKEETDQGKIGIFFAKEPIEKELQGLIMGNRRIDIEPGVKNYVRTAEMTLPVDVDVVGHAPHMHYIGTRMKVWAVLPDGTEESLIYIDDWNFNWQGVYYERKPRRLPAGTKLKLWATYDNSADNPFNPSDPPVRVRFGEESFDEMCFYFLQVTVDDEDAMTKLRTAMIGSFARSEFRRDEKSVIEGEVVVPGPKAKPGAPTEVIRKPAAPAEKKPAKKERVIY